MAASSKQAAIESPHFTDDGYHLDKTPHSFSREDPAEATVTWWRLFAPCLAFAGVEASWAAQIGYGSAVFRKLGLSAERVALAWLAAPITGVLVQPVVGALSDRCTSRFGRRRPFMLFGNIGLVVGMVLFSNAARVAARLGDPVSVDGGGSPTAVIVALLSFWLLDATQNALQAPTRALLSDVAPARLHARGNSFFAAANGLGKAVGYAVGGYSRSVEFIFGVTAAISFALTLVTIVTVKEAPLRVEDRPSFRTLVRGGRREEAAGKSGRGAEATVHGEDSEDLSALGALGLSLRQSVLGLFGMPKPLARVWLPQFFTYFAWEVLFVYGAVYVGKEVFGGNVDAPPASAAHRLFEEGLRFANRALLVMSLLSAGIGLVMPLLLLVVGLKVLWMVSLLLFAIPLLLTLVISTKIYTMLMISLFAFSLAAAFIFPWTIVMLSAQESSERGLLLSTLNTAQDLSGVFASVVSGFVVQAARGNLTFAMVLAGSAGIVAVLLVPFVSTPPELRQQRWRLPETMPEAPESSLCQSSRDGVQEDEVTEF